MTLLPGVVLLLAAVWLGMHWDELPPSWPVHWGADGEPNGYAERTVASAFGPLGVGVAIWLIFEALTRWVERRPRAEGLQPDAHALLTGALADFMRCVAVASCAVVAFLSAALPVLRPGVDHRVLPFAVIGLLLGSLGLCLAFFVRRIRGVPLPEGYGALVYSNPRDSRLWVPKLLGVGWTLNFAHAAAIPTLLALLALPPGLVWLLLQAVRPG